MKKLRKARERLLLKRKELNIENIECLYTEEELMNIEDAAREIATDDERRRL